MDIIILSLILSAASSYYWKMMSPQRRSSMKNLADEVMLYILSKLPLKTIIQFKCVCKKWLNLISESYFADLYMRRSPECILVYRYKYSGIGPPPGVLMLAEIEDELNHDRLVRVAFRSLDIADLFPASIVVPVGSIDGFICLWESGEEGDCNAYICNPITKEYIILPKPQFYTENFCEQICGFGVSKAGEYKVIRIGASRSPCNIEVYTIGTNRWRTLCQVPFDVNGMIFDHGIFFNGHVYFIFDDFLFSFNLDNETFQRFPLPPPPHGEERNGDKVLGVLEGCLSLLCKYDDLRLTIWVMKERGIKKFWHKELDVKEDIILFQVFEEWFLVSLIDGLNGRSLLMVRSFDSEQKGQLVAYCIETNEIEETTISDNLFTVLNYRPSFCKLQNFQSARVHVFYRSGNIIQLLLDKYGFLWQCKGL